MALKMRNLQRRSLKRLGKVVREHDHQFLFYLVNTFKKLPDDEFIIDMNPITKLWLYESWLYDKERKISEDRDLGIFIGSFSNPEAAKKMYEGDTIVADDEASDKVLEDIRKEDNLTLKQRIKRRRDGFKS